MFVCRVCLENSGKLISLTSRKVESLLILHMLKDFTIDNTEDQLSNFICETCAANLDIAFKFKRQFEDSIIKFIGNRQAPAVLESSDANRLYNEKHVFVDDLPNQSNIYDENNEQLESQDVSIEDTEDSLPQMRLMDDSQETLPIRISSVYQLHCWTTQLDSEQNGEINTTMDDIPSQSNTQENNDVCEAPPEIKLQSDLTTDLNKDLNEKCPETDLENKPKDLHQIHLSELVPHDSHRPAHVELLNSDTCANQSNVITVEIPNQTSCDESQLQSEEKLSDHDEHKIRPTRKSRMRSNRKQLIFPSKSNLPKSRSTRSVKLKDNRQENILTSHSKRDQLKDNLPVNLLAIQTNRPLKVKDNRPANLLTYSNKQLLASTNRQTALHQDLRAIKKKFRSLIICSIKNRENFDSDLTKKIIDQIYMDHFRKNKSFRCDVCHRWFKTKGHVKTHRMVHIHTEYELQCNICRLRFLNKTHFKVHKCTEKVKGENKKM